MNGKRVESPAMSIDPKQVISDAVEGYHKTTNVAGVSVAVYDTNYFDQDGYVYPFGVADVATGQAVVPETVFGIGSVTKVFTSLLTAYAVVRPGSDSAVQLTDKVTTYLTAYGMTGSATLDAITLGDLATHTAGMPDMDSGMSGVSKELFDDEAPSDRITNWWKNYSGPTPPNCWSYSNLGFVTLGFAVTHMYDAQSASSTYDDLLQELVTGPLKMLCTTAHPDPAQCASIAKGYEGQKNNPATAPPFDLKSSAVDLLTFLKANLKAIDVPDLLAQAIDTTQTPQGTYDVCANSKKMTMGLGWQIPILSGQQPMYYKNGAASGFSCAIEFVPNKFGIAVLTNQFPNANAKTQHVSPSSLATTIRKQLEPDLSTDEEPADEDPGDV